jgi:hypothetical protein
VTHSADALVSLDSAMPLHSIPFLQLVKLLDILKSLIAYLFDSNALSVL